MSPLLQHERAVLGGMLNFRASALVWADRAPAEVFAGPGMAEVHRAVIAVLRSGQYASVRAAMHGVIEWLVLHAATPLLAEGQTPRDYWSKAVAWMAAAPGLSRDTVNRSVAIVSAEHLRAEYQAKLNEQLQELQTWAHDDVQERVNAGVAGLSAIVGGTSGAEVLNAVPLADDVLKDAIARWHDPQLCAETAWPIGCKALDTAWSTAPGDLDVLVDRSGGGKTMQAQWELWQHLAADPDCEVAMIPLVDVTARTMVGRLLSYLAQVDSRKIMRTRPDSQAEADRLMLARSQHREMLSRYTLVERAPRDVHQLEGVIRNLHARAQSRGRYLRRVVVDYAQAIEAKAFRDPNEAARVIFNQLAGLSSALGTSILVPAQWKKTEARDPGIADLYGSTWIRNAADSIRLVHGRTLRHSYCGDDRSTWPAIESAGPHTIWYARKMRAFEMKVAKSRHGEHCATLRGFRNLATQSFWFVARDADKSRPGSYQAGTAEALLLSAFNILDTPEKAA